MHGHGRQRRGWCEAANGVNAATQRPAPSWGGGRPALAGTPPSETVVLLWLASKGRAKADQIPTLGDWSPVVHGHGRQGETGVVCVSRREGGLTIPDAGWSAALQPPPSERWRRRPRVWECSQWAVFTKHAKTDRGAMIDKHRQHERERTRRSERTRGRGGSGVACAARRLPPTPMRAYPPRCERASRRPPTRDVPSQSQPAQHPACVRTHVNARARAHPRNEQPRLARCSPPRSRASVSRNQVHRVTAHLSGVVV